MPWKECSVMNERMRSIAELPREVFVALPLDSQNRLKGARSSK